jgi:hypothetical protein
MVHLCPGTRLDNNNRVQITIWDKASLRANECLGGMSFSFSDIASTAALTGWFCWLPFKDGRTGFVPVDEIVSQGIVSSWNHCHSSIL